MPRHPDPLDREIGARLKLIRRRAGVSQAALGAALGVSFQQVQKYETGANRVSGSALIKLARVLGVSALDLLGRDDDAPRVDWALLMTAGSEDILGGYARIASAPRRRLALALVRALGEEA